MIELFFNHIHILDFHVRVIIWATIDQTCSWIHLWVSCFPRGIMLKFIIIFWATSKKMIRGKFMRTSILVIIATTIFEIILRAFPTYIIRIIVIINLSIRIIVFELFLTCAKFSYFTLFLLDIINHFPIKYKISIYIILIWTWALISIFVHFFT